MGERGITAFLTHLAVNRHVAPSTQNQALAAILFLYKEVLERELDWMDGIVRAKRRQRIPEVLSPEQVRRLIDQLQGTYRLMAQLLYGTGMRLMETVRLRICDVDFHYRQITVRNGKGSKDRVTVLPGSLLEPLRMHLLRVKALQGKPQGQTTVIHRQSGISFIGNLVSVLFLAGLPLLPGVARSAAGEPRRPPCRNPSRFTA